MGKAASSFVMEMRLLTRSVWTWVFLLLSVAYVTYMFWYFLQERNPGGALTMSGFLVQAGIFVSMILGHALVKRESANSSEEVFQVLPDGLRSKLFGKTLALLSVLAIFLTIALVVLYTLYSFFHIPGIFYRKAFYYVILYWGFAFVISGLIGMMIGTVLRSKPAYLLLLLLWVFLGPLNVSILQVVMVLTGVNMTSFLHFVNLGQTDLSAPYNPVYGLPMEFYRWMQKLFLLATAFFLFAMIVIRKIHGVFPKRAGFLPAAYVLISLPLCLEMTQQQQVIHTQNEVDDIRTYDMMYYKEHAMPSLQSSAPYHIEAYDLNVTTNRKLKVQAVMKVVPEIQTDTFVFTLYHDLHVKQVLANKQQVIEFRQVSDQTEVVFPKQVPKGQAVTVSVEYEGVSSPFFFANEQAVMLPSYFPWIPMEGAHQAMKEENGSTKRYLLGSSHETEYTLRFAGPGPLYTNLPNAGDHVWKGRIQGGITIVGGMMFEQKIGDTTVVYPASMQDMIADVSSYLQRTNQVLKSIRDDWRFPGASKVPKTVFFLSVPGETNQMTGDLWVFDDHMIVSVDQDYNLGLLKEENGHYERVLSALIRTPQVTDQQQEMTMVLTSAYEYWVHIKNHAVQDRNRLNFMRYQAGFESIGQKDKSAVMQRIGAWLEQQIDHPEQVQTFFQGWLGRLEQPKQMQWQDVSDLMKVREGGR